MPLTNSTKTSKPGPRMAKPSMAKRGIANHILAAVAFALLGSACGSDEDEALAQRQAEVAEAGVEVMPFDLDRTTHIFTETDDGGIQDVIADDTSDDVSIGLIREHLAIEADKFSHGDFSDPTAIHGAEMPGLSTLKDRFAEIEVTLLDTDAGATITYETDAADLVPAIHDWFKAQASDHGGHAEHHGS